MGDFELDDILACLSQQTWNNLSVWVDVGASLHHIHKGQSDGLEIWKRLTKQNCPTRLSRCDEIYAGFFGRTTGIINTIRNLGRSARQDNLDMYERWHQKWLAQVSDQDDMTELIYRMFWLDLEYRDFRWCRHYPEFVKNITDFELDAYMYISGSRILQSCTEINMWRCIDLIQQWRDPITRMAVTEKLKIKLQL